MVPMFIQGWEWLIVLAVALLIFGGGKLAGLGRGAGRAIREFKEETKAVDTPPAEADRELGADRPIDEEQRRDG